MEYRFWYPPYLQSAVLYRNHGVSSLYPSILVRLSGQLLCCLVAGSRPFLPRYLCGAGNMERASDDCPSIAGMYSCHIMQICGTFHDNLASFFVAILSISMLQDLLGPRFCLPASLFPRAYDYHRQIPAHVLRGSHSPPLAGSVNTGSTPIADVESGGLIECVICYNAVETDSGNYMVSNLTHPTSPLVIIYPSTMQGLN